MFQVLRENNVFATSIYCKPTFSGVYTHFVSFCTFLNKVFIPKRLIQTTEKKQETVVLIYMGVISTEIEVQLNKTFKQLL